MKNIVHRPGASTKQGIVGLSACVALMTPVGHMWYCRCEESLSKERGFDSQPAAS